MGGTLREPQGTVSQLQGDAEAALGNTEVVVALGNTEAVWGKWGTLRQWRETLGRGGGTKKAEVPWPRVLQKPLAASS